jgi:hypothetical protein
MIIAQVTAAYTARARTLVTKMMFWALAGVTFSAAKIVSCNKKKKFHGLPATLLQLFYFISVRFLSFTQKTNSGITL